MHFSFHDGDNYDHSAKMSGGQAKLYFAMFLIKIQSNICRALILKGYDRRDEMKVRGVPILQIVS